MATKKELLSGLKKRHRIRVKRMKALNDAGSKDLKSSMTKLRKLGFKGKIKF